MPRRSRLEKPLEWYPWNPLQWQSSRRVQRMSWAERGIYRELMDECYLKGGIPLDKQSIATLLGEDLASIDGLLDKVLSCFKECDGRLICPSIEEIREDQLEYRASRANRTKKADHLGPVVTTGDHIAGPGTTQVVFGPQGQDRTGHNRKELNTSSMLPSPSARSRKAKVEGLKLKYSEETVQCGTALASAFPPRWLEETNKPQIPTPKTTLDEVMQRTDLALEAIHKADPKVNAAVLLEAAFSIYLSERKEATQYISGLGVWLSPNPKDGKMNYATYLPRAYRRLNTTTAEVVNV